MSYVISYFEKESEKSITRYIYFLNKLRIVEYTDILVQQTWFNFSRFFRSREILHKICPDNVPFHNFQIASRILRTNEISNLFQIGERCNGIDKSGEKFVKNSNCSSNGLIEVSLILLCRLIMSLRTPRE